MWIVLFHMIYLAVFLIFLLLIIRALCTFSNSSAGGDVFNILVLCL